MHWRKGGSLFLSLCVPTASVLLLRWLVMKVVVVMVGVILVVVMMETVVTAAVLPCFVSSFCVQMQHMVLFCYFRLTCVVGYVGCVVFFCMYCFFWTRAETCVFSPKGFLSSIGGNCCFGILPPS